MKKITMENIDSALCSLGETAMTMDNLRLYVLLCQAKEYMLKLERHRPLTKEDADDWVKRMKPAARWTMEQTTSVMQQKCYNHDPSEFFAVMNSLASDYGKTISKYGMDKPEIWAELAHDWLCDEDAVEGKTTIYYREIVKSGHHS